MKLFYLLINFTDSDPETRNNIIRIFILIKLAIYIQWFNYIVSVITITLVWNDLNNIIIKNKILLINKIN